MDERAIEVDGVRRGRGLFMECGSRRVPVIRMTEDGCVVETPDHWQPRGFADIFDGERHVERCLIVLASAEGTYVRCSFKRRTASRLEPPRDFAG